MHLTRKSIDIFLGNHDRKNHLHDKYGRTNYSTSGLGSILQPTNSLLLKEKYDFEPKLPNGASFVLLISHDIDRLTREVVYTNRFAKATNRLGITKAPYEYTKKIIDTQNSLKRLIEWNHNHDVVSTYFVLNLLESELDYNYSLQQITPILQDILLLKNEIGLHGSHTAYCDASKMKAELDGLAQELQTNIYGYRNHYLRYDIETTTNAIDACGFQYDSTLGYPDCVGFRNGVCHPFNVRNADGTIKSNFFEIPLLYMDTTVLSYMRYDFKAAIKVFHQLIEGVIACKGIFSMLMHNDSLETEFMPIYAEIIKYAKDNGAWITTKKQYLDYWVSNNYNKIFDQYIANELQSIK